MNDASEINTDDNRSLRERFKEYLEQHGQSFESITETNIMVYPYIKEVENGKQVRITEVINDIRTKSERKNIVKEELPVGYFSASMIVGRKLNNNVTKHSGLIIIDIDKDKNPDVDLVKLMKDLQNDKYTYACFNSPRGGIKVIINTNIKSKSNHKAYFNSIKEYLLTTYTITEIDKSGCNVARACYLPYDNYVYFNINASKYSLNTNQIDEINAILKIYKSLHNISNPLLQVESISFDEHYDNILNLVKNRTSVGLNDNENRTSVGIYDNIFNKYRYISTGTGVMSTYVPFWELLVLKNMYPYRLDFTTRLDEYYFKDNLQKPISTDSIEGLDGMEVCEVVLPKGHVIKEHYRAWTLGSISMKLIFNNPFCHPDYILKTVLWINDRYCEDQNPINNPKPNDEEVRNIVMNNYQKFLNGELDFSKVIRKKHKKNEISKKYVFMSRQYVDICSSNTHLKAVRIYFEGKRDKNIKKYVEAVNCLQDGKKITQKRIAKYMGMTARNLRRYETDQYDKLIQKYNETLKLKKKQL